MKEDQVLRLESLLQIQFNLLKSNAKNYRILSDSLVNALPQEIVWPLLEKISKGSGSL